MLSLTPPALTSPSSSSRSLSGGATEESGRSRRSPVRNAPQQPGQGCHTLDSLNWLLKKTSDMKQLVVTKGRLDTAFSLSIRYQYFNVKYEHVKDDTYLYL